MAARVRRGYGLRLLVQICENPPLTPEIPSQVDLDLQLSEIREHIRRARRIAEDQRSRIRRIGADGRSMKLHEHLCQLFERSLAHMEKYERMLKDEIGRSSGQKLRPTEHGEEALQPAAVLSAAALRA